jgi:uncharacterized membrane protein
MSISCPECEASIPEAAASCPACGRQINLSEEELAQGKIGALPRTVAGALAYCALVPAILFLLVEPYKEDRFVRFHSFQSIGLTVVAVAAAAILRIAGVVLALLPRVGPLMVILVSMAVGLGVVVLWGVVVVKALQGEMFELPWIGEVAQRQAEK